ncbi:hypothetical protein ERJ75_001504000 [Trypanosoma vivax]|nr:hypothetical protein ERJ75_001504000 [Trypanosoma vivax]
MCVGASTAVERDPCNAPRVAPSASHNNRTVAATRCATQRAHASLTRAAPHSHAQGDGSKQLKGTATANSQGAQARTATLIRLPLVEVALALVQRGALAMAHAHRSAAAEHGERCSHHLLFAAPAPHPRNCGKPRRVKTSSVADTARTRVSQRTRTVRRSTASNGTSVQQHTATALLPPLSLRAQLLSAMPPQSVLPLDTRLSGLTGHAARGAPSAQATQHSTSFESASHWQCSNTRATAPTAHASSVACAPPQSSALPHTAHRHAHGRAVRWPRRGVVRSLSLRVISALSCWRVACASSEAI